MEFTVSYIGAVIGLVVAIVSIMLGCTCIRIDFRCGSRRYTGRRYTGRNSRADYQRSGRDYACNYQNPDGRYLDRSLSKNRSYNKDRAVHHKTVRRKKHIRRVFLFSCGGAYTYGCGRVYRYNGNNSGSYCVEHSQTPAIITQRGASGFDRRG